MKSLKDGYRWQLWLMIAINALFLWGVVQSQEITTTGLAGIMKDAQQILPVGFAVVVATVLNGILSAEIKARLVFFRWTHALPGHRAFTFYANSDNRIDVSKLRALVGDFPADPAEQNRTWYRLYKSVDSDPSVQQVHRDFLLTRDCTGLAALLLIFFGAIAGYTVHPYTVALTYVGLLALQFIACRQAAFTYGARMVTTVLALKSAVAPREKAPARAKAANPDAPEKTER
jgi:hypothetical protein